MLTCPNCKALHVVKYGKTRSGTQNYKCRECGRRFVEHPTKKYLSQETWAQIDKLLKEKLPLRGIARVTGISGTWLQRYVNRLYEKQRLEPQPVKKRKLCLECDEMWSFVGKSQEKVWVSFRQRFTRGIGSSLWEARCRRGTSTMGFTASGISSMCGVLYLFLGGLQESASQ
jgi:transposase-like protein